MVLSNHMTKQMYVTPVHEYRFSSLVKLLRHLDATTEEEEKHSVVKH